MAELVDALDSGSSRGNSVDVRVILAAIFTIPKMKEQIDHLNLSARAIALVANGAIHDYQLIAQLLKSYERIVAVDGGLMHCHQMNIQPDYVIGDFDSAPQELLEAYQGVPSQKFPTDKDETDLELAVEAINSPFVEKIGIFGALELRTDHALNNLFLLYRFPNKIIFETELETVFAITGKKEISCSPGQKISLLPFCSQAKGVTTQGLQWELHDKTLDKHFVSISNVCLSSTVQIDVGKGELICCLSRDNLQSYS